MLSRGPKCGPKRSASAPEWIGCPSGNPTATPEGDVGFSRRSTKGYRVQQNTAPAATSHLSRSLGLWAIVGLGLGYMTPMTVFDTFGIVSEETDGVVPLAYIVALVAMVFTALSYGRMTRVFPSAGGSAFTYASEVIHPNVGFLVGWSSLLDYLLLPMVNAVIGRIYFESFFPRRSVLDLRPRLRGDRHRAQLLEHQGTSNINGVLVVFQTVLIGVFVVLTYISLTRGLGQGTALTLQPLYHAGVDMQAVIAGATVVCFSFIGFDAITMYSEEAKTPNTVPQGHRPGPPDRRRHLPAWGMVRPERLPPHARRVRGHRRHPARARAEGRRRLLQDSVRLGCAGGHVRFEPVLARQRLPDDLRDGSQSDGGAHPAFPVLHPSAVSHPRCTPC